MKRWTDQMICELCMSAYRNLVHPHTLRCMPPSVANGRRIVFSGYIEDAAGGVYVPCVSLSIRAIRRHHLRSTRKLVRLVLSALKTLEKRALEIAG